MNKKTFLRNLLVILCFYVQPVCALVLKHYTVKDRLGSNTVYNSICDSKGYMWFCTDKGLTRFDGRLFKNFMGAEGVGDNEVFNLYEDKGGRIWLFTYNGAPSYYYNDRFYNAESDNLLSKMPVVSFINAIYEDGDKLYVGYNDGRIILIEKGVVKWVCRENCQGQLTAIVKEETKLKAISQFANSHIISGRIAHVENVLHNKSFLQNDIVLVSNVEGIFINRERVYQWADSAERLTFMGVLNLYCDNRNNLFISTRTGLMILDRKTGQTKTILEGQAVTSVRQDRYSNYWITTLENGVFYINAALLNARTIQFGPAEKAIYNNGDVFIKQGKDYSYVQITGDKIITRHLVTLPVVPTYPIYMDSYRFINSFFGEGLGVYDRKLKQLYYKQSWLEFKAAFPLKDDTLLLRAKKSIHKLYWNEHGYNIDTLASYEDRILKAYMSDYDHKLYYLTGNKLFCYDPQFNNIVVIDSFKNKTIECIWNVSSCLILCDHAGRLYVYDCKAGYKKVSVTGKFIVYHVDKIDSNNYLLQTNKGYKICSIKAKFPHVVSAGNVGFPFNNYDVEFLHVQGAYVVAKIGEQLVYVRKELVNQQKYMPGLYCRYIDINGRRYTSHHVKMKNTSEANVKLIFSAVTDGPEAVYSYRVLRNERWGNWHYTTIPDLDIFLSEAGTYRIEVRARSGDMRSEPVYVTLDIHPPFLRSAGFYVLLVVFGIAAVLAGVQWYIRSKKKLFRKKLEHLQLEHKAINTLLNPHFIFNVVNNIQDLINSGSKERANKYLVAMSRMIRQNIENLQFTLVPVADELELVENYIQLQNLRFNNRIILNIDHDIENPADVFVPPLMIHNFVENAIVHGLNREQEVLTIDIAIKLTLNDYLDIKITDNGKGMPGKSYADESKHKTSMGIAFNRQRLQRLSEFYKVGYRLEIDNRPGNISGVEAHIILYARFARLIQP